SRRRNGRTHLLLRRRMARCARRSGPVESVRVIRERARHTGPDDLVRIRARPDSSSWAGPDLWPRTAGDRVMIATGIDHWKPVCHTDRLTTERGVAALIDGVQIALFRTHDG